MKHNQALGLYALVFVLIAVLVTGGSRINVVSLFRRLTFSCLASCKTALRRR